MKCRHCQAVLHYKLVDLGSAPPSNAYLTKEQLNHLEKWFPLRVLVCENCWLVQTEDFAAFDEIFDADYAYFSGYSKSWLAHARHYVQTMIKRFDLDMQSYVVEVAANDGYLLQYFKQAGIPCLGIEPTKSTAEAAREKGIEIVEEFFGEEMGARLAENGCFADVTVANNVLAHVPDINDFVLGFSKILKPSGVSTFEFPSLMKLLDQVQFDTIYHEHFSYLSLTAVNTIFSANGLHLFDIEELTTHGGSLRVFAQRLDTGERERSARVNAILTQEQEAGLASVEQYQDFQNKVDWAKDTFISFLIEAKREGKLVAGYGAAAKGNTLINYAGIRPDLISFVVDRNPAKRGKYLPGSRIPILDEAVFSEAKPDYICILPWNLCEEISEQLQYTREWDAQFVTAIPMLKVF